MKTRKLFVVGFAILVAGLLVFTACKKDNNTGTVNPIIAQNETTSALDNAGIAEMSDNVTTQAENTVNALDAAGYSVSKKKSVDIDQCETIVIDHPDSTYFPKVITITFGACSDSGGAVKRGTIIITVNGRYWLSGSTRSIRFIDFTVNDKYTINGYKTIENQGFVSGYLSWKVSDSIQVTFPGISTSITRKWDRIRVLQTAATYDGTLTSWTQFKKWWKNNWWHAMFAVTETGLGTNRFGDAITINTVSPLYYKRGCKHILAGDLVIENTTRNRKIEMNWGDDPGTKCGMNLLTITITDSARNVIVKHPGHWDW
jgi:hypothetical protein